MSAKILVIDDEESMCNFMQIMLSKEGFEVQAVSSPVNGIELIKKNKFDLVIADLNMPEMSGIEVLRNVRDAHIMTDFIVMTAFASVDTAIEAMKEGASDYITKPFKVDEIRMVIDKCLNKNQLIEENTTLKNQLKSENSFDKFLGNSEGAKKLKNIAAQVAVSDSTVLILGESGTGKDLISKAIHSHSPRSGGPFVTINCGALPENLLESELFGHKKGSFTGAIKDKDGLFKVADGGTLFLDEIGNTSPTIQIKLLRALEDNYITPVGGIETVPVDVRLLAATNANLEEEVKSGNFRADLFYRLNVIPIFIPPLRERREDISLMVSHFIKFCSNKNGVPEKSITAEAMSLLENYDWPGNVRELENTIERAVLLNEKNQLDISDFSDNITKNNERQLISSEDPKDPTLESIEKAYIHFVVSKSEGKKSKAAKILGIDTSTLYRKLEKYKLKDFMTKNEDISDNPENKKK